MVENFSTKLRRILSGTSAAVLLLAVSMPTLLLARSAVAAQVQNRSITISDSTPSGVAGNPVTGVGSGVGVTYQVQFDTSASAQSLIIDFCSNTPLVGDSCTAPTGFTAATATASVPSGATSAIGGWTITPSTNQVKLSGSAAQAAGTQTFNINGITNPSDNDSFYARVYTYSDAAFGGGTPYNDATDPGNFVDNGGFALSTSNVIQITARVMETLQFCVLDTAPTNACANADGTHLPNITLGHGTNQALDGSVVDTAQVFSQLSTNAVNGAAIRAHLNNACGGLSADGGTSCPIGAINAGGNTPIAMQDGNTSSIAAIGLNVGAGTGTIGSTTPDNNYLGTSVYGWDTTSASGGNLIDTFGDTVATSTGPTSNVNNTYTFAATAVATTPAGIYTGEVSLIATGTF